MPDKYIVIDFETTGLKPGFRPVEIAWLEFDDEFNILESVSSLINPQIEIERGAQAVHGISQEMVQDAPTLDEFIAGVHGDPFRRSEVLVVAHNAKFDFPIIAPFCGLATRLCTLELAWVIYPEAPNHKLNTLANFCAIDKVPNHRALDDIETCFALLQHFAKKTNNSLLELLEFSQDFEAISIMPFGKHKGSAIKDLPNDYKKWLFENFESDDWIIQVLKS